MIERNIKRKMYFSSVKSCCVLVLSLSLMSLPVFATEAKTKEPVSESNRPVLTNDRKSISESKTIIDDIKIKEPFINIQEEIVWDFEQTEDNDTENKLSDSAELSWLSDVVNFMAVIIELILWMIPLLALFFLYKYKEYWLGIFQGKHKKISKQVLPETLFGLDMKPDSLPDDIEKTAFELWENHHYRDALSLLYRGSIISLFERYRFTLPSGATEQDCIRYLQSYSNDVVNADDDEVMKIKITCFKQITDVWIAVAYAHKLPEKNVFYEICNNWNNVFINNMSRTENHFHSKQVSDGD